MNIPEAALRIGSAARELGITRTHMINLCRAHLVEYDSTPGGHKRIFLSEVNRLKSEGVPPNPVFAEEESEPADGDRALPESKPLAKTAGSSSRLAPPSPEVIGAHE